MNTTPEQERSLFDQAMANAGWIATDQRWDGWRAARALPPPPPEEDPPLAPVEASLLIHVRSEFEHYAQGRDAGLPLNRVDGNPEEYGAYATRAAWRAWLEKSRRPAPPGFRLTAYEPTPDMGYAYLEASMVKGDKRAWAFNVAGWMAAVKASPKPVWG